MNFITGIQANKTEDFSSSLSGDRPKENHQQKSFGMIKPPLTEINEKLEEKEHLLKAKKARQELIIKSESSKLVLWQQPIKTLSFCLFEIIYLIKHNFKNVLSYRKTLFVSSILLSIFMYIYKTDGSHQQNIETFERLFIWSLYWVGLGVASSAGLGTGLHTFILYLGPFIAQVTLAAYECGSTKFPRPPYPKEIVCPSTSTTNDSISMNLLETGTIPFWKILWKVKLEAFCWGLGTAIGELPPYFVARAARLGTSNSTDDDLIEVEQLLIDEQSNRRRNLSFFERLHCSVYHLIERVGFFGILLCASVPNPLFDLAGITCGYFLIPFWRFFLATVIGKALIKMSLQTIFIIFLFSEHHVENIILWMNNNLSHYGSLLEQPFKEWLDEQKSKMHRKPGEHLNDHITRVSTLSKIFNFVVAVMIGSFIISIINSLAQRYYKRIHSSCK